MTQGIYKVLSNENIAPLVYKMVLSGDTSALTKPGQFINFKIDGLYLRRCRRGTGIPWKLHDHSAYLFDRI